MVSKIHLPPLDFTADLPNHSLKKFFFIICSYWVGGHILLDVFWLNFLCQHMHMDLALVHSARIELAGCGWRLLELGEAAEVRVGLQMFLDHLINFTVQVCYQYFND